MELKSYKEQINEVQDLIDKLEQGELSLSELTDLELATRSLHERSIILKYKAFEAENLNGSNSDIDNSEPIIEEDTTSVDLEAETEEAPFDWNPTENDTETSIDTAEEIPEAEEEVETPPSIQEIMGDISEQKETIQEIIEENMEVTSESVDQSDTSFVEKLNLSDQSKHSLSIGTKIDSLIGAFGLNEKLRFINDLFDGSSESFNEAIKTLDSQEDMTEANSRINDLASVHSWEAEEETVTEFVAFVNRRYA